jgi:hypothetical protein
MRHNSRLLRRDAVLPLVLAVAAWLHPAPSAGQLCEYDEDCKKYSYCEYIAPQVGHCLIRDSECSTDADCSRRGDRCSRSGRCVRVTACTLDASCPEDMYCDSHCLPDLADGVICKRNPQCRAGSVCSGGVCVRQPTEKEECVPYGLRCSQGLACNAATVPPQCQQLSQRDGPCAADGDCIPGLKCIAHLCSPLRTDGESCDDDAQCTLGLICKIAAPRACSAPGDSGTSCAHDRECVEGLHCVQQRCAAPGHATDPCEIDKHCQDGLFCVAGECRHPGLVQEPCKHNYHCARDLVCLGARTCGQTIQDGGECTGDTECGSEARCIDSRCWRHHSRVEIVAGAGPVSWVNAVRPALMFEISRRSREQLRFFDGYSILVGTDSNEPYLWARVEALSISSDSERARLVFGLGALRTQSDLQVGAILSSLYRSGPIGLYADLRPGFGAKDDKTGRWSGTFFCTPRVACWIGRLGFDFWLGDSVAFFALGVFPADVPSVVSGLKLAIPNEIGPARR